MAEIATIRGLRKTDVYAPCDGGRLHYGKFEGIVQIEGRDPKAWLRPSN